MFNSISRWRFCKKKKKRQSPAWEADDPVSMYFSSHNPTPTNPASDYICAMNTHKQCKHNHEWIPHLMQVLVFFKPKSPVFIYKKARLWNQIKNDKQDWRWTQQKKGYLCWLQCNDKPRRYFFADKKSGFIFRSSWRCPCHSNMAISSLNVPWKNLI